MRWLLAGKKCVSKRPRNLYVSWVTFVLVLRVVGGGGFWGHCRGDEISTYQHLISGTLNLAISTGAVVIKLGLAVLSGALVWLSGVSSTLHPSEKAEIGSITITKSYFVLR
jgi:hypothetical protein